MIPAPSGFDEGSLMKGKATFGFLVFVLSVLGCAAPPVENVAVSGGRLRAACEDGTTRCFADAGPDAPAR